MPATIFSHQSVVLPLKIRYPQLFDCTALCIGSMMPDLDLLLPGYRIFHALESLVILLPLALVFVILFDNVLAPRIAVVARRNHRIVVARFLRYFGMDALAVLQSKRVTLHWLIKATYSVLIGILSHFLLDLPTHHWISYLRPFFDGPMPLWFLQSYGFVNIPVFGMFAVTRARVLQWVFSVGFGLVALYCLRYMKKHRLLEKWYQ
jgi:hypothetical protein